MINKLCRKIAEHNMYSELNFLERMGEKAWRERNIKLGAAIYHKGEIVAWDMLKVETQNVKEWMFWVFVAFPAAAVAGYTLSKLTTMYEEQNQK